MKDCTYMVSPKERKSHFLLAKNSLLICRFRCSICFQTVSILPHFLLPYFQHTTRTIVQWLHDVFHQTGTNPSKRQLISFYLRRFIQTISWIYMYFAS
ncbi:DUF6431 domain-containing protein [Ureibacillus thermophilus]|uniref:DUF6431 domain-containing protein n=1 Tax=Ureibacillus thermophilus TaxID=367743 RepID=UPI00361910EC